MKVFGTGFGRTGTMSLKIALEKLGMGRCYHMKEIALRPSHIKIWYDISCRDHPKWNQLFNSFDSGVEYPELNAVPLVVVELLVFGVALALELCPVTVFAPLKAVWLPSLSVPTSGNLV